MRWVIHTGLRPPLTDGEMIAFTAYNQGVTLKIYSLIAISHHLITQTGLKKFSISNVAKNLQFRGPSPDCLGYYSS